MTSTHLTLIYPIHTDNVKINLSDFNISINVSVSDNILGNIKNVSINISGPNSYENNSLYLFNTTLTNYNVTFTLPQY